MTLGTIFWAASGLLNIGLCAVGVRPIFALVGLAGSTAYLLFCDRYPR